MLGGSMGELQRQGYEDISLSKLGYLWQLPLSCVIIEILSLGFIVLLFIGG